MLLRCVSTVSEAIFNSPIVFDSNATCSFGLRSTLNKNIEFDGFFTNTLYLIGMRSMVGGVTLSLSSGKNTL